jgi:oligopeptide/dipeptide ABC transporter ATP-binding protein
VNDLTVEFRVGRHRQPFRAVDHVSIEIAPRETLGLVGESGSGKTTLGRAILGLVPITSGTVFFAGADITRAGLKERRLLSTEMQVVFQDPYSSLNPARTIGQTLRESLLVQGKQMRSMTKARVPEMLERVGLPAAAANRYPRHFSGGQRQRIAIARALMTQPKLVVCDEPVSALDLSVQAQVLNLLRELQDEFGLSYLFIAHDLAVVRHLSQRIVVLYRGQVMEQGTADAVYRTPAHPYTRALLEAAPQPDPELQRRHRSERPAFLVNGAPGGLGCPFASRCPHATDICRRERPILETTPESTLVACHRWRELRSEPGPTVSGVASATVR